MEFLTHMNLGLKNIVGCFVLALFNANVWSQTCCTAGAPVGTYLGIQNTDEKSLAIQIGYEYNSINLLIDDDERIKNDPRSRFGQSASFKIDYSLNRKFALSTILSLVHQSRSTFSESQRSLGLGDLIFLTQYSLINDAFNSLNFSAGAKLPIGTTNHRSDSNILLSPDMQSGTGSYDFIFRGYFSKSNLLIPFLSGYLTSTFRINGTNSDFGSTASFAGRKFAFGNESVTQSGLRYLITLKKGFLNPDVGLKVRWTDHNMEQNVEAPNSGGYWINLPFGISFTPDNKKSIAILAEIPLYQKLDGLQISTNYKFGIQLNYILQNKHKDSILN